MKRCVISILLFVCTLSYSIESLQKTFDVLAGIKLLNPYRKIYLDYKYLCASHCLEGKNMCGSANYNRLSKLCELNKYSPLNESPSIVEDKDWDVIYVKDGTWELAFRGTSGIGISLYSSYTGSTTSNSTPEVGCRLTHTLTCTTHYRNNAILDNWELQNIKKVKFAMYKNNVMVVNAIFINRNTDSYMDWFNKYRLISSSYTDFKDRYQKFNYFSISGFKVHRRFYINKSFNGCLNDYGWIAVFEDGGGCDYQSFPMPYLAYMPHNTVGHWKKEIVQSADVIAIFVQRSDDNGDMWKTNVFK